MGKKNRHYVQKHLYVPQERIAALGLLGIGIRGAVVLSYLYGWFRYKEAKRIRVQGAGFIWLNYNRLVQSLPLLDLVSVNGNVNRRAVRAILDTLVASKLIELHKVSDMTVYFRLLPTALAVFAKDEETAGREDREEGDGEKPGDNGKPQCEIPHRAAVTERTGAGEESHNPSCESAQAQEEDLPGVDPQAGDLQDVDLTPPAAGECVAIPSKPEDLQDKPSGKIFGQGNPQEPMSKPAGKISGKDNIQDPHSEPADKTSGQGNPQEPQSKPSGKTLGTSQPTPACNEKTGQDQNPGRAAGGADAASVSPGAGTSGAGEGDPLPAELLFALPRGTPPHAVPEEYVDQFISLYDEIFGDISPREKTEGSRMEVTGGRRDLIKDRLAEAPDLGYWRRVFEAAKTAPHCTGQTTGWKMTFGWIIQSLEPSLRILEGAYARLKVPGRSTALQELRNFAAEHGVSLGADPDSRKGLPN